ncbi:MAG: hypothetical protein HKO13_10440 [Sphingomonas sp.]|uniref:hypothetical protein n=1 Tax=Sphingomicrobium marinum TaxID=1227950 RepID=UPI001226860B|nr:hypothetical protein [Sphingomicrobium marinum]NNC48829.1 hypothetical protein [Sphingomonas sp.]RZV53338.1 MAG: hypothetical protein EX258_00580 [Sphingomonadaceae bacterium]
MIISKVLATTAAAALVAAPVGAATRPAAAVPAVTATSSTAALQDDDYGWDAGTVVIGLLAAGLIIWGIIELFSDEDDSDLPVSLA